MEDNFTKELMNAIVSNLLVNQVDQYGNVRQNPIETAVNKWAENHKDEILEKVGQKLTVNMLATKAADKLMEKITAFGGSYSSYDKSAYKQQLDIKIIEKLAERIAAKIDLTEK